MFGIKSLKVHVVDVFSESLTSLLKEAGGDMGIHVRQGSIADSIENATSRATSTSSDLQNLSPRIIITDFAYNDGNMLIASRKSSSFSA